MDSYPEERVKATKTDARAPGLDGVRALAVLAVIGFHAGATELSGGFLGVDIFFVLSGFLITDLLVAQYARLGRLDLKNFWGRRARRLLPPLAVMLVVVTAVATVIEPGQESSLRLALLAAATYTSNWYQIIHHVSYFASIGPMPPLDHLWSLAIEEQFYLIWPLLLWFLILKLNGRRAWIMATLLGAGVSALAMAIEYTQADPSAVYYSTYTHASALLIGAALALAFPLATLASAPVEQTRRLDAVGVAGLAFLAWAIGHYSGSDPAVYPAGLILAALGAAALVAAAASNGVIAAMTGLPPLRWVGVRSYAMYLWHWPVIALTGAVVGQAAASSPWLWIIELGVTVGLAAVSWRFIEAPILQNGFRVTCRHWMQLLKGPAPQAGRRRRNVLPTAVAAISLTAVVIASYGIARPPAPVAPTGLLRQVAEGERVGAASRAANPPQVVPATQPTAPPLQASACRPRSSQPTVSGWQITAIGDSVMVASAAALEAAMPGIYIDAQVGRQMATGLSIIRNLARRHRLRHFVVVGLGTNGDISAAQLRLLRRAVGSGRDLILINTFGPMSWESEVNAVIASAVRHTFHEELANWNQTIRTRTNLLWPDGIHPRSAGARLYARIVVAAVRADLPRGQPSSCRGPTRLSR